MPRLVGSGLNYCKQRLKYDRNNSFSISKFEGAQNEIQIHKIPAKVVFGHFYMDARIFTLKKKTFTGNKMCQTKDLCHNLKMLIRNKGSHDTKTIVVIW